MTNVKINPKISYVEGSVPKAQDVEAEGSSNVTEDVYEDKGADGFQALLNGTPKAESLEGGVLEEMFDAASDRTARVSSYQSPALSRYIVGETYWKAPQDYVGDIPYVPDLSKDILAAGVDSVTTMEPVVARYAGLETVLEKMIDVASSALNPNNMSTMTAHEFRMMEAYRRKLVETLNECKLQRSYAEKFLAKQREMEEAGIW